MPGEGARRPGRPWGPRLTRRPAALLGILRGQQMRARGGRSEVRAGTDPPKELGAVSAPVTWWACGLYRGYIKAPL